MYTQEQMNQAFSTGWVNSQAEVMSVVQAIHQVHTTNDRELKVTLSSGCEVIIKRPPQPTIVPAKPGDVPGI